MFRLFLSSLLLSARLWVSVAASPLTEGRSAIRAVLIVVLWPLFVVFQLLHWLGFLVDDIFFREWRGVTVGKPVFVLGPPRSGTTHLHHVLSRDPSTTTFRLWECLIGPSITGRRLMRALTVLDRKIGRPIGRLGGCAGRRLTGRMDDVHPLSLEAPEEDFLVLLPAMQCFILITLFPNAEWLWRTARLDREVSDEKRARLMQFYADCVRKHLYVCGTEKLFLSKNASFSGSPESLLTVFPDACFFTCSRDPVATVPSQLSSIEPALRLAGFDGVPVATRDRLLALMAFYYRHLDQFAAAHPARVVPVTNEDLHQRLAQTVLAGYRRLDLPVRPEFEEALAEADHRSRSFQSGHRYRAADYGLTSAGIRQRFATVYTRPDESAPPIPESSSEGG